jgi:hypothetical protein
MKNLTLLFALFLTSCATVRIPSSHAGTVSDGGGGAYVCRDAAKKIISSHLVDLWEAENVEWTWPNNGQPRVARTIKIRFSNANPEQQFQAALSRIAKLDGALADEIKREKTGIFAKPHKLPESISISVPEDLRNTYFPTSCEAEGMMLYRGDKDMLDIRPDIFAALATNTDIAAAWMHEALYKVLRTGAPIPNSKKVRRLNACLFSTDENCLRAMDVLKPLLSIEETPEDARGKTVKRYGFHYVCEGAGYKFDLLFKRSPEEEKNRRLSKLSKEEYQYFLNDTIAIFQKLAYRRLGYDFAVHLKGSDHFRGELVNFENARIFGEYSSPFEIGMPFNAYDDRNGAGGETGVYVQGAQSIFTVPFHMQLGVARRGERFVLGAKKIPVIITSVQADKFIENYGTHTGVPGSNHGAGTCMLVP